MAQSHRKFSKVLRLAKLSGLVDQSGARAQVLIPGFTPDDFDRTGNLSVWRLQRLMTYARLLIYHTPNPTTGRSFLEYDTLTQDKFTFMASIRTTVERSYYTLPDQPQIPHLALNIHLGYLGGASLNTVAKLVDKDTGTVYATNTNQVVMVDKTTRKPTLIPTWWKDKYQGHVMGNEKLVIDLLDIPDKEKCHKQDVKVSWNDTDAYKHTNFVSYIRYCFDAAMDATVNGHFSQIRDDVLLYPAKQMEISYKGESLANDELTVKCWENEENPFLVHFDISRQGKTLFQNSIEFYGPKSDL